MKTLPACLALSVIQTVASAVSPPVIPAPVAQQRPHSFTHHGITLDDPWHWLRDPKYPKVTDKKVLGYLKEENRYFEAHMDGKIGNIAAGALLGAAMAIDMEVADLRRKDEAAASAIGEED
jgi:hypothetical protein